MFSFADFAARALLMLSGISLSMMPLPMFGQEFEAGALSSFSSAILKLIGSKSLYNRKSFEVALSSALQF